MTTKWTKAQRAKFKATMAAKKRGPGGNGDNRYSLDGAIHLGLKDAVEQELEAATTKAEKLKKILELLI